MLPDQEYPGQHWSELLPEYEILMYSISGSSNGIIAYQFYQGLEHEPDAVVIGFTEPNRLEFLHHDKWITGLHQRQTSAEQRLLADAYKIHTDQEMLMIKDCSLCASLLWELETRKIPYAWVLNLLYCNLTALPFPNDPWVNKILGRFFYRMTETNLATYQGFKMKPGFHTDDPAWQNRFAIEARTRLESVDFLSKNY